MANVDTSEHVSAGSNALARGAWADSRALFRRAIEIEPVPEAMEGLATASWWIDDDPAVFEWRERAYRLYLDRGDRNSAARMATWLALDHWLFHGAMFVAHGWLRRAHRHLDGMPPGVDAGWLAHWEAHLAFFGRGAVRQAGELAAEASSIGRAFGVADLEAISLALSGLVKVAAGDVEQGMRQLDEAAVAALSGEVEDPDAAVTICCYLIAACERVRDWPRALEWCARAEEMARRWAYHSMFAYCRGHYAAVLFWRGDWARAEAELTSATHELMVTRPGWVLEPIVLLAELRLRQGRPEQAEQLFAQAPGMPHALLGRAELALDTGRLVDALGLIDRFFRRVPGEDRILRAEGLELAVRVWLASGDIDRARSALDEMESIADAVGTDPLEAASLFARGLVLAATGDLTGARQCQEDAVDLFAELGAPYETARARFELARLLMAEDRRDQALTEARAAFETLCRLGAEQELRRAEPLWRGLGLGPAACDGTPTTADLTPRESEVLCQVARGLSNREIADRLYISVRTVERHISSIYAKIGADGTAARAVATVYAFERGLARAHER